MLRTLTYFWRMNAAVAAGAAIATSVLIGALLVGDSVRGSLRDLTLERLGGIDQALTAQRFFAIETYDRLLTQPGFDEQFTAAPAILLKASARHADSGRRASGVGLQGVDDRFFQLFGDPQQLTPFADIERSPAFPPVLINKALADAVGASLGDSMLISLKRWSEVPSGSLLSRDDTSSVVETVRTVVAGILPDSGLGAFGLETHQGTPFNVFVPLADLQRKLDQRGKINAILVAGGEADDQLSGHLDSTLELRELGLLVDEQSNYLSIESDEYILSAETTAALETYAEQTNTPKLPILTYLANGIRHGVRLVPYSTVTAMDPASTTTLGFGDLSLVDGSPAPALGDQDILLNQWTADNLAANVGDQVSLEYFVVGDREELTHETSQFTVRGIVALTGLGADATLSQEYPGIAGNADMAEWDPPFPIDLNAIREADEDYWDDYRATPKAFVNLAQGQRMWQTRWGKLTAMRLAISEESPAGESTGATTAASASGPSNIAQKVSQDLRQHFDLAAAGWVFQPVKRLSLSASGGATDFGGLFAALSWFVITAAALLVALLFSLVIQTRASEIGLRLAVGFRPNQVRRQLLAQGAVLAAIGGLVGIVGALAYGSLMMYGLKTWWLPAVGTSKLSLHISSASLIGGLFGGFVVVLLAIYWTSRSLHRLPAARLLKKGADLSQTGGQSGRRTKLVATITLTIALLASSLAIATGRTADSSLFSIIGPCLLIGLLAAFAALIDHPVAASNSLRSARPSLLRMALVNSRRQRSRSLLATALVASATFLIVVVAAYQHDFSSSDLGFDSGAGGYGLVAQADIPLQSALDTPDGRFTLGLDDSAEQVLKGTEIVPFRLLPGDDTSCLNLYQPQQPRLLGVPRQLIERGGFSFKAVWQEADNPWQLLDLDFGENIIPVIGDANSTQWILKLPLGGDLAKEDLMQQILLATAGGPAREDWDLVMENERGEPIRLRLVANLATSVFQSELLMSEEKFLEHFPSQGGYPYFLVESDSETLDEVATQLESGLAAYGVDARPSREILSAFHSVQNTYLSTFRSLGGLGLLLGTLGLAVVLIRNVIERRSELAALRAFGFRRTTLRWMILGENLILLIAGLAIGTLAALATAGAHVLHEPSQVPWLAIVGTLGSILLFGLVACVLAAYGALKAPLLPALKAET